MIGLSKGEGQIMGKRVSEQLAIDEAACRLVQVRRRFSLVVPAPTGRRYANTVLEHGYVRYSVTQE